MLIDIKGHLIDPSKITYVSPITTVSSAYMSFRERGYHFFITLSTGDKIEIEETEFWTTHEELKKISHNMGDMYNRLKKERDKISGNV